MLFLITFLLLLSNISAQIPHTVLQISNNSFVQTNTNLSTTNGFIFSLFYQILKYDNSYYTLFDYTSNSTKLSIDINCVTNTTKLVYNSKSYIQNDIITCSTGLNYFEIFYYLQDSQIQINTEITTQLILDNAVGTLNSEGVLSFGIGEYTCNLNRFIYYNYIDSPNFQLYYNVINAVLQNQNIQAIPTYFTEFTNANIIGTNYKYINTHINLYNDIYTFSNTVTTINFNLYNSIAPFLTGVALKINDTIYDTTGCLYLSENTLNCVFQITAQTGDFEIYISNDNINWYATNHFFHSIDTNTILPKQSLTYTQLYGISPVEKGDDFNTYTILYIGIGLSVGVFLIGIIGMYKWERFENICSKLDFLRFQKREEIPIQDPIYDMNSFDSVNIAKQSIKNYGISYRVHKQTTAIGGILTVVCAIMTLSLIGIYLDTVFSNNDQVSTITSISNGLTVDTTDQSFNISITIPYLFPNTSCVSSDNTEIIGSCAWDNSGYSNTITPLCIQKPSKISYFKDCTIQYNIQSGFDTDFTIQFNSLYAANFYYNTTLSVSSYLQNSVINNVYVPKKNNLIQNINYEYSLTSVAYSYYNDPVKTGNVLDYITPIITEIPIQQYQNSEQNIPGSLAFTFTKNNNWIFVNVNAKNTNIVILAQFLAILVGVFNIGRYILQIAYSQYFIKHFYKHNTIEMNKRNTINTTIKDNDRESMSYIEKVKLDQV